MKRKRERSKRKLAKIADIGITNDTLTSRGGLNLFVRYLDRIGVLTHIRRLFGGIRKSRKGRLNLTKPDIIELHIDTMVMDNDEAEVRHGVEPTYKKKNGFQPLQMTWERFVVDAVFRARSSIRILGWGRQSTNC